jgi:hypothetical protein
VSREQLMKNQEERGAKEEGEMFWRTCPICLGGNAASPRFKDFLPLMRHMAEHFCDREMVPSACSNDVLLIPQRRSKQKFPPKAKLLLAQVADWLEKALNTFQEINSIGTSDVKTADQLVDLTRQLPDQFGEQREYLLKHKDKLRGTGMDPKWWTTPGRQTRFIAEWLAGAEWDLQPSVSREFIRQCKPRRGARPGMDQQWWDPAQKRSAKDRE